MVGVASPGVFLEGSCGSGGSPPKLAQGAEDAEPASELCCLRASHSAGLSWSDDKIYQPANPHPHPSNVPYIRLEMYTSCFHSPSNQHRWFCFRFQPSGKGVRAHPQQMLSSRVLWDVSGAPQSPQFGVTSRRGLLPAAISSPK